VIYATADLDAASARVEAELGWPHARAAATRVSGHTIRLHTAVVLPFFDAAEHMSAGDEAFGAMDPSETPGTRASVDMCELKLERRLRAGI
jgi:hypothetical protein